MLAIENLSAGYGPLTALSGVTLKMEEKARVGVFGHNGAGKTTLLKCIVGEHAPSAGAQAPTHGGGHATVRTYINVAIVLAVITAIEVATLYVPGIPNGLLVVGLLLMSAVKFFLVVGFFMHLRYDHNIMRSLFIGPLIIAICIIMALMALFSAFVLLPRH